MKKAKAIIEKIVPAALKKVDVNKRARLGGGKPPNPPEPPQGGGDGDGKDDSGFKRYQFVVLNRELNKMPESIFKYLEQEKYSYQDGEPWGDSRTRTLITIHDDSGTEPGKGRLYRLKAILSKYFTRLDEPFEPGTAPEKVSSQQIGTGEDILAVIQKYKTHIVEMLGIDDIVTRDGEQPGPKDILQHEELNLPYVLTDEYMFFLVDDKQLEAEGWDSPHNTFIHIDDNANLVAVAI